MGQQRRECVLNWKNHVSLCQLADSYIQCYVQCNYSQLLKVHEPVTVDTPNGVLIITTLSFIKNKLIDLAERVQLEDLVRNSESGGTLCNYKLIKNCSDTAGFVLAPLKLALARDGRWFCCMLDASQWQWRLVDIRLLRKVPLAWGKGYVSYVKMVKLKLNENSCPLL